MGGLIFDGTRDVTQTDVQKVSELLDEYVKNPTPDLQSLSYWTFIGSFNNRKARDVKTMGDLDILIYTPPSRSAYQYNPSIETIVKTIFGPEIEIKESKDDLIYVRWNDIQIDFHRTDNIRKWEWIKEASTVPFFDTYKPLYRNEILFQVPKYTSVSKVRIDSQNRVRCFTRGRFTPFEGFFLSTYNFQNDRGQVLKNPVRSDYRITSSYSFEYFLTRVCDFSEKASKNPTFFNLIEECMERDYWEILKADLITAFQKKMVHIPEILL